MSTLLPDPQLFLYAYVRREAVLSSQIEGTQSSLSDLLLFELEEAPGTPIDDVVEVSNYIRALEHGMARLREGFPLCNRLLREMHAHLMSRGRGSDKEPGEFRRTQNWIGGTRPGNARFVPAPPHEVEACMAALEAFLHEDTSGMPVLLKAALARGAVDTARRLVALFDEDTRRIQQPGRSAANALRVLAVFRQRPILSLPQLCQLSAMTFPTANKTMGLLVETGIARELTGQRRNRVFSYDAYLTILNEGGDPL